AVRVLGMVPWRVNKAPGTVPADAIDVMKVIDRVHLLLESDGDAQVRMFAAQSLTLIATSLPLEAMGREKDVFVRFCLARTLRRTCDWKELSDPFNSGDLLKNSAACLDVLLLALADQCDAGAVALLKAFQSHPDGAVRKRALEVLGRVHRDRKPYAGGWWGTR